MVEIILRSYMLVDGVLCKRSGRRVGRSVENNKPGKKGYVQLVMWADGRMYRTTLHRAKFAVKWGWLPETVDHKDGNTSNNALDNLRAATPSQQAWNTRRRAKSDPTMPTGVHKHSPNTYRAQVFHEGKMNLLGSFSTKEEASMAYQTWCREHRGEYHTDG